MARVKTKYTCIYFNEDTKKYDVKFNYKEYDPKTAKNKYRSKWCYNCSTITEAKEELNRLRLNDNPHSDADITLSGILEVWRVQAEVNRLREGSIVATERQLKAIGRYMPLDTKLKNITIDTYNALILAMRKDGLKERTIHTYLSCLRKMLILAYRREFITVNIFAKIPVNYQGEKTANNEDSISTRLITKEEFLALDNYLQQEGRQSKGEDSFRVFRLLFNLLYYSGVRIGEALALVPADFEAVGYYQHQRTRDVDRDTKAIFQVGVTKTIVDVGDGPKIQEGTKNHKNRYIPLPLKFETLYYDYMRYRNFEIEKPVKMEERLFNYTPEAVYCALVRYCKAVGIKKHSPHDFRHTYISNLVALGLPLSDVAEFSGDSENTIIKTYIHATEDYKFRLLETIEKLQ